MFRKASRCFLAGFLAAVAAQVAIADVVTLQPVDDAYISNGEPDTPWNTDRLEQFGYYGAIKRPLLKFDLSSIPDGSTVLSADLTLQLIGWYGGDGQWSSAWRVPNDNWSEETVTWNSCDQTGAVSVAILPGTYELGTRTWNISLADWAYAEDLADNAVTFMTRWDDSHGSTETDAIYKWNTYSSQEGTVAPTLTLTTQSAQLPGDLNCDGSVDFGDINPFVLYLSNFANWQAAFPGCPATNGDINGDGLYPSFDDINPFVALLTGRG